MHLDMRFDDCKCYRLFPAHTHIIIKVDWNQHQDALETEYFFAACELVQYGVRIIFSRVVPSCVMYCFSLECLQWACMWRSEHDVAEFGEEWLVRLWPVDRAL